MEYWNGSHIRGNPFSFLCDEALGTLEGWGPVVRFRLEQCTSTLTQLAETAAATHTAGLPACPTNPSRVIGQRSCREAGAGRVGALSQNDVGGPLPSKANLVLASASASSSSSTKIRLGLGVALTAAVVTFYAYFKKKSSRAVKKPSGKLRLAAPTIRNNQEDQEEAP